MREQFNNNTLWHASWIKIAPGKSNVPSRGNVRPRNMRQDYHTDQYNVIAVVSDDLPS